MAVLDVFMFRTCGSRIDFDTEIRGNDRTVLLLELSEPFLDAELADGTRMADLKWKLALYDQGSEGAPPRDEVSLGSLQLTERRDCIVSATLKGVQFSRMLALLQAGKSPDHIEVTVEGLREGASGAIWDVSSSKTLRITGLSFSAPLHTMSPQQLP